MQNDLRIQQRKIQKIIVSKLKPANIRKDSSETLPSTFRPPPCKMSNIEKAKYFRHKFYKSIVFQKYFHVSKCKYEILSLSDDICDIVRRWRSSTSRHYTQIYILLLYDGWSTAHLRNSLDHLGKYFFRFWFSNSWVGPATRHGRSSDCRRGNDLPKYRVTENIFYKQ